MNLGHASCDKTGARSFFRCFFTQIQIQITELSSFPIFLLGLVSKVFLAEELVNEAIKTASKISSLSKIAAQIAKEAVNTDIALAVVTVPLAVSCHELYFDYLKDFMSTAIGVNLVHR